MPARRSLPPLEFCRGTRPIQAARFRPDLKALGSGMAATRALASSGPTPGTSISLRPVSVAGIGPDPAVHLKDLPVDERELPGQHPKAGSRFGGYTFIGIGNQPDERSQ